MDLDRIANLFCFPNNIDLINYLQERAVIAGGSVVYALNTFVPKDSVGDVDVFVNDKFIFSEIMSYLHKLYPVERVEACKSDYFGNGELISVVNVFFKDQSMSLQIILEEYKSLNDVIESFDLDYVQCAFHKGEIYTTYNCRESHKCKEVRYSMDFPPSIDRLLKAINKGFSTPVFGYSRGTRKYVDLLDHEISHKDLTFITRKVHHHPPYKLSDTIVMNIKPTKMLNSYVQIADFDIMNGELKSNVKYVSLDLAIRCQRTTKGYYIDRVRIGEHCIKRCKCSDDILLPKLGAIVVNLIRLPNIDEYCIFQIQKFYSGRILPMKLDMSHETLSNPMTENEYIRCTIKDMIKKHENNRTDLSYIKANAYEYFLYHSEKYGINRAVGFSSHEFMRYINNICGEITISSVFRFGNKQCNTVEEMIDFIEGFS